MLYPQIPKTILDNIAGELNINAGFFNFTLKGNQDANKTSYDKLHLVSRYIEKQCAVGTMDSPKEYFKGTIAMRWGPYGGIVEENPSLVYFGGITNSGTILGLGGSLHHVIGEERGQSNPHSHSASYAIISTLSKELDMPVNSETEMNAMRFADSQSSLWATMLSTLQMRGPYQTFEFLAKKLAEGTEKGKKVVLGTPIYVAYAE
jgi:hypothetical protein